MTLVRNPEGSQAGYKPRPVEILILGAGWSSTFLIRVLNESAVSYAATSTTGREGTIPFRFDPSSPDPSIFEVLPDAKTVLIVFPLAGTGQSRLLVDSYAETHPSVNARFVQLGSVGIWSAPGGTTELSNVQQKGPWFDRHSPYNRENPRAVAEDELRDLGGCVLNLSGLWGGERKPWNFLPRAAATKDICKAKASLHMIHVSRYSIRSFFFSYDNMPYLFNFPTFYPFVVISFSANILLLGRDVARSILAVHRAPTFPSGTRWLLTDMMVYDWWALLLRWGDGTGVRRQSHSGSSATNNEEELRSSNGDVKGQQLEWIRELLNETNTRALPRAPNVLGRCYDSREFWETFGLGPVRAGL